MKKIINQLCRISAEGRKLMDENSCTFYNKHWKDLIGEIEDLIFTHRGTEVERELLQEKEFGEAAKDLRKFFYMYELSYEHDSYEKLFQHLCSCDSKSMKIKDILLQFPPIARTYDFASQELASLSHKSSFIHIGSGPCPESVLSIWGMVKEHDLNCKICALDRDFQAIKKADDLFQRVQRDHNLDLLVYRAEQVDYSVFSHILVAVMVRPEFEVIKQIVMTACKHHPVEILLRTVNGLGQLVYEPISEESVQILEDTGFRYSHDISGDTIMKTMVFLRDGNADGNCHYRKPAEPEDRFAISSAARSSLSSGTA